MGGWQEAKFLIGQQKYLELLEAQKTMPALNVLRNELAPLNASPDQLHSLTKCVYMDTQMNELSLTPCLFIIISLIMCSDAEDLRQRAGWDGAYGNSRLKLLANLQRMCSAALYPSVNVHTVVFLYRVHPILCDDTSATIFDSSQPSTFIPTTTLCLPQLTH